MKVSRIRAHAEQQAQARRRRYRCSFCRREAMAFRAPKCPVHGTFMGEWLGSGR